MLQLVPTRFLRPAQEPAQVRQRLLGQAWRQALEQLSARLAF